MPVNTLTADQTDETFETNADAKQHYFHSETVNAATGDWLIIPSGIGDVCLSVAPSSGSARVEWTQATVEDLETGSPQARPWDAGDVSAFTSAVMASVVTAVRCVSTGPTEFVVSA